MALLGAGVVSAQQAPAPAAPGAGGRAAAAGRGAAGPRVVSPEILPDKTVTFRLLAPKAGAVVLNGSWENGTNIAMAKDDQGIWSVTVGPLGEQLWAYSFSADGLQGARPRQRRDSARRQPVREHAHDCGPRLRPVGVQAGRPARHRAGCLVSVAHPEAEDPSHVRLYAARLHRRQREVPSPLPVARHGRR